MKLLVSMVLGALVLAGCGAESSSVEGSTDDVKSKDSACDPVGSYSVPSLKFTATEGLCVALAGQLNNANGNIPHKTTIKAKDGTYESSHDGETSSTMVLDEDACTLHSTSATTVQARDTNGNTIPLKLTDTISLKVDDDKGVYSASIKVTSTAANAVGVPCTITVDDTDTDR